MPTVEELSIPVPWGKIAAKAWGSADKPQVLAIHGLNDNAASFDQLIPELGDQLYVICVDLPGHGLSSHFPPGLYFSLVDYAYALKRVVDHLGWSHFNLLAHSVGSQIVIYFTALFGQSSISQVLLIDAFFAHIIPESDFILEQYQAMFTELLQIENNKRKCCQYKDSLKKLCEERPTKKLAIHSAIALQKRAFKKTMSGYIYNNDVRIKILVFPLITYTLHFGLIKRLNCHLLLISTSEFEPFLLTPSTKSTLAELRERLGWRMRTIKVEGSHDVHMDHPQTVAPIIKQFLSKYKSHL